MRKKVNINCQECENLNCSLLKNCTTDWLDYINQVKVCFKIKKGHNILFEGNSVDGIHFIQEGKVKVYKTGINRKEQIVRLSKAGDILGHRGWNRKEMPVSANAIEDSKICFVNSIDFNKILQNNPKLIYELMLFYSDELHTSEIKARNLAQMQVIELLTDALLYILETYGENKNGYLNACLSRQEIADLSGTTKEQVSKYLSSLKNEGIIETNKNQIKILSPKQLKEISYRYIIK